MSHAILTKEERLEIAAGGWFASLSPVLRHDIFRLGSVHRFLDGQVLCHQGRSTQYWHVVVRGAVCIYKKSASGRSLTHGYLQPGTWFGEESILGDVPLPYASRVHGYTTMMFINSERLSALLKCYDELHTAFFSAQMRRIHRLTNLAEDLHTLSLRARLAKRLLELDRDFGNSMFRNEHGAVLGLPMSQTELADLLGSSRQRVNLELKSMEREGLISIGLRSVSVCDTDALALLCFSDSTASH